MKDKALAAYAWVRRRYLDIEDQLKIVLLLCVLPAILWGLANKPKDESWKEWGYECFLEISYVFFLITSIFFIGWLTSIAHKKTNSIAIGWMVFFASFAIAAYFSGKLFNH